ncbi:MAG: DNA polymerase III subunit gamma/tau [Rhodocyclaceae bacterium]
MSYQVLARKWRPKSFGTLVGQEHVVRALSHALATGRLHHAWLFTGTRGVGKTTISRILAKALNCETGITAEPCGQCAACTAIDADRFPDYVEMDAASNRGVEDMAALLDQAVYAPVQGRYKVYMIDEVHMLTGHAFNAMLKTLEEPPEHVKFILATTDPQKIPVTVLSRCLQFNLKQMPPGHIVDHLTRILEAEQVAFEAGALRHIAKAASGSMRDALSLLDQAIAHGAGQVAEDQVTHMLGTVGDDHLFAVLDALLAGEAAGLVAIADQMEARSLSFDAALQTLASLLHRIALAQFAPGALADDAERARLAPYMAAWDPEYLQLAYQVVIHGRSELALAPDDHAGFTMTLLRLLAFRPEQPVAWAGGALPAGDAGRARPLPAGRAPLASPLVPPEPAGLASEGARAAVATSKASAASASGEDAAAADLAATAAQDGSVPDRPAVAAVAATAIAPEASGVPTSRATVQPESLSASTDAGATRPAMPAMTGAAGGGLVADEAAVGEAAVGEAAVGEAAVGEAAVGEAAVGEDRCPPVKNEYAQTAASSDATACSDDVPPWMDLPAEAYAQDDAASPAVSPPTRLRASEGQARSVAPDAHAGLQGGHDPVPAAEQQEIAVPSGRVSVADEIRTEYPGDNGGDADLLTCLQRGDWHAAQRTLGLGGMVRELAQHCECLSYGEAGLVLRLSRTHRHLLDMSPGLADRLNDTVSSRAGRRVAVRIEIGDIAGETPAQRDEAIRRARHAEAVAALEQDPFVRELIERFDATLVEESVRPL